MTDMTFEIRGDEVHMVGTPPQRLVMSVELLETSDSRWVTVTDETVTFHVTNGTWSWRIVDRHPFRIQAELIEDKP